MHPFKSFLFFTVVMFIALLYKQKDKLFPPEAVSLPPIPVVAEIDTSVIIKDEVVFDSISIDNEIVIDSSSNPLHFFFDALKNGRNSLNRIIWMGDSQLEGDHMTYSLRVHLQEKFGGKGIGYMPATTYFNTTEGLAVITNDFDEVSIHTNTVDSLNVYGLYGKYFATKKKSASIRIKNRNESHSYEKVQIIYSGKAKIDVSATVDSTAVEHRADLTILNVWFKKASRNLELTFDDCQDLKIYALLFDANNGVAVDHVPFRGNLNLMLNKYDGKVFKEMGAELNPSLVILQFGLNVIPDVRMSYADYQIALERDLKLLKKYLPNASIVVFGAPDMAHKVNGEMVPYENIDAIIEAQKLAAQKCGAYFWDMRSAMGGKGIVVEWEKKGYVRSDFAHLTAEGTAIVTEKFYANLMAEYDKYLNNNDK